MKKKGKRIILLVSAAALVFCAVMAGIIVTVPAHAEPQRIATIDVKASPIEALTDKYLGNAQMQVLSSDGKVLDEWTSVAGKAHVIDCTLALNETYILHQVTAPDGYTQQCDNPADNYDVNYTIGRDTTFQVVLEENGLQKVTYSYYQYLFKNPEGEEIRGIAKYQGVPEEQRHVVPVFDYRSRTLEIGKEVLGNAGDTEEYFEVILDIPNGIPGQVMNVDLSNADSSRNPSSVTIPDNGVVKASFWLKDGQSVKIDGFPLYGGSYYQVHENNETMDQEGYITRILAAETMNQVEADSLILQGIELISKAEPTDTGIITATSLQDGSRWDLPDLFPAQTAHAAGETEGNDPGYQYEVPENAVEGMAGYANEEMFAVEDPVVDTAIHNILLETLGVNSYIGDNDFTISDTLTDGVNTDRSASKFGCFSHMHSSMLIVNNGVFGDARVLFINRRDGVPVEKQDEEGTLLAGSTLQILGADGEVVHEFTSTDKPAMIVGLAPGEYKLHEVSAPAGYLVAEDVAFTVEDLETVETVAMTDPVDPNAPAEPEKPAEPENKVPNTGDHVAYILPAIMVAVSGTALTVGLRRRKNSR